MHPRFTFFAVPLFLFAFLAGSMAGSDRKEADRHANNKPTAQTEPLVRAETEPPETFLVTRAIDGDTIEIENGSRIRMIGIDAPETADPRAPVQCFGAEAARRNRELVEGHRVALERDVSETDKYGRLLRYVYADGAMINELLVKEGYARAATYPPDVKYEERFRAAEREAREARTGLWGGCPANVPPAASSSTRTGVGCVIKGNISPGGKIFHAPGCGSYDKTAIDESRGERWFCSEEEAVAAGWRKAKNCP